MRKLLITTCLLLAFGSITRANAPTPNQNAAVQFVTICSWDTSPACITYQIIKGIWSVWKK